MNANRELGSKIWNIRILKYSRYSLNKLLWFGKPQRPIFPDSVKGRVCVAIVFHSSHLGF
jgi:hypothetical protein